LHPCNLIHSLIAESSCLVSVYYCSYIYIGVRYTCSLIPIIYVRPLQHALQDIVQINVRVAQELDVKSTSKKSMNGTNEENGVANEAIVLKWPFGDSLV